MGSDTQVQDVDRRVAAVSRAHAACAGSGAAVRRLVQLAWQLAGADVVAASLVSQRTLILLGSAGSDMAGVPQSMALCRETVASGLPLIVRDVVGEPRFAGAGTVRGDGVRAYAGFPVTTGDGLVIGVLAAARHTPYDWSVRQLTGLDTAAQLLADLIGAAVTAEEREQLAGQRPRAFLDALLDSLDAGVAACDRDGRLVLVNPALRRFSIGPDADIDGSPPQEWTDRFRIRNVDGSPCAPQNMPLVRALQGDTVRNVDQLMDDYLGRPRRYTCNATPIRDTGGGACLGAVVAVTDVTDQRRVEQFRACEIAVARAMLHTTDLTTVGHTVIQALAETLGWPYAELWLHERTARVLRPAARWARDGLGAAAPLPARLEPGTGLAGAAWTSRRPVWIPDIPASGLQPPPTTGGAPLRTAVVVPVRSGDDVSGAIVLCSTAREQPSDAVDVMLTGAAAQFGQHLQQRDAHHLALQLARSKDEYLRLVGHELRTPLTSIAAATGLLTALGDDLPAEAHELLQAVTRNSDRMRRTVDALLDIAALDSGHVTIHPAPFDLAAAVRDAVTEATAIDQPVRIRLTQPQTLLIDADHGRIRTVLTALLSNAVHYSHPGGAVHVTLTTHDDEAVLTVTDTGIGIPADELPHVFDRFHRGSRPRALGIPGTGLGLAASHLIVQHHHGTITLHPGPHGGTTAALRLPHRQPGPPATTTPPATSDQ